MVDSGGRGCVGLWVEIRVWIFGKWVFKCLGLRLGYLEGKVKCELYWGCGFCKCEVWFFFFCVGSCLLRKEELFFDVIVSRVGFGYNSNFGG